jgi:1-aminocyclopropane-1-carboxylate deaminase
LWKLFVFMEIFSPLQKISYQAHPSIWVKRDDLIDPYISGNKWRKLKWILHDMQLKGKTHVVTFGGAYSNHLLATAAATARFGLKASAFVRGEQVSNETLLLCNLYGMRLIFVDREIYKNKQSLYDQYFTNDQEAYFVDEGGASEEAIRGCSELIDELHEEQFDYIFCAAGTGTTAAGLLKGILQHELQTQLHVIPVLKGGEFIANEMGKYENNLDQVNLHTQYHFGGYAKATPALLHFIKSFASATGILTDPVYTAKMFYAIYDLLQKGKLKEESKILAVHTGGLLGLLGMKQKLNEL